MTIICALRPLPIPHYCESDYTYPNYLNSHRFWARETQASFDHPSLVLHCVYMVAIWCLYGSYMVPPYFLRSSITLPSLPTPCPSPCLFWNFAFQHPSHDMMALSPARILRGMHRFVPAIDIIYAWTQAGRRFALS